MSRQILALAACALIACTAAQPAAADGGDRMLRIDHYVGVRSTVPAIAGQTATVYVREVVRADTALRGAGGNPLVLFVHGAGTPGAVAFDVQHQDYSWMEFLARAGFDTFAMDMTGYGRSTRPAAMNDPCNLSAEQQLELSQRASEPCSPSYPRQMTTIASDWNDLSAVVDHLLALRHASHVSLVAWSLGGPRSVGYAAQHPDKVQRLVLLAPAYNRDAAGNPPTELPAAGFAMTKQSRADLDALWNRQVGCPDQYDRAVSDAVWSSMVETDPVGATWGSGVRRAPSVTSWGFNANLAAKTRIPTLMVAGIHDKQVAPTRVHDLFADLGASKKVLVDLACSSHNAMWEKNHLMLFQSSLEWLSKGSLNGMEQGKVRLGY